MIDIDRHGSTMRASLRELRMVLERLVQAAGIEPGLLSAIRDCALCSVALGPGGLAGVPAALDILGRDGSGRMTIVRDDDRLVVDGGNRHAWSLAPALADLAVDRFRRGLEPTVGICHVAAPEELAVSRALVARHGLGATLAADREGWRLAVVETPEPVVAGLIDRLRRHGLEVDRALWWQLYLRSKQALAPDSVQSRRHAGAIMVTEDGRVVGRCDEEDTDLAILTARSLDEIGPAANDKS